MRYSESRRYRDSSFTMTSEPIVQDEVIEPAIEEAYQELVESTDIDVFKKLSLWNNLKLKLINFKK